MVKRHERIRGTAVGIPGSSATLTEARNSNPPGVRERNRVSRIFNGSLRGILSALMLTAFFMSYALPIQFQKSIPESGSTISSFDFTLEFDITEALELAAKDKPGTEVGLGYWSGNDYGCATLYRGDAATGIELGQAMTSIFNGKSDGFKVNGNTVKFSFDPDIPVIANERYTVVITNTFYLFISNKATKVASTASGYLTEPIILTFKGEASDKPQLECTGSNIEKGATLNECKSVEFSLSSPFNIKSGAEVLIMEGEDIVGRTSDLNVSSTDNKVLVADFNDVPLLLSHSYTIVLPANSVTHIDDATVGNFVYKVNVNGSYTYKIPLKSSKVDVDSFGIPIAVTFVYDLPEGTTLDGISFTGSKDGFLSVDGSDVSTNFNNYYSFVENGKGIRWDLSLTSLEPATKYNFTKDGNTLRVLDAKNSNNSLSLLKEYSGEDASISFTVPSVEEIGAGPLTVGKVKLGNFDDESVPEFVDGGAYANINTLEIRPNKIIIDGKSVTSTLNWNNGEHNAYIYDVTDGNRKEVKVIEMASTGRGGDNDGGLVIYDYSVFLLRIQMDFLQDHTYEIVIPKGAIRLSNSSELKHLYNYFMNDEIVYTVKGATPSVFTVDGCSVEDNAEMSALPPAIVWTVNGAYDLKNINVTAEGKSSGASASGAIFAGNHKFPITLQKDGYKTYVAVHLIDTRTGMSSRIQSGQIITVTIPAGSIVYPGDESLSNPALTVSVKGVEEVIPAPETVNVNLTINDHHSTSHKALKGEKYEFTVQPNDSNWEVESVKHGDKTLAVDNAGMYVTEPLNADAEIKANLRYAGPWATDITTDVWQIESKKISIRRENDMIVIDGVTPDNTICVYNVAGMLINSTRTTDGNDRVRISVPLGQVYIVTVDGFAARIMMTERQ